MVVLSNFPRTDGENLIRGDGVPLDAMTEERRPHGVFGDLRRILGFLIIFETLSLTMHYYVFAHLTFILDVPRGPWFWPVLVLMSLLWFLAMGAEMRYSNLASRVLYYIGSLWLGMLMLFMFILIGYDVVRFIRPVDTDLVAPAVMAIGVAGVVFGVLNARILRVREVEIPAEGRDGDLTIAHLSDIHIGSVYGKGFLSRVVDRVNDLAPDLVLITGDLADGPHRYTESTFSPLDRLEAPAFFTTGNHEYYAGLDRVLDQVSRTKVRVLRNEVVEWNGIRLVGVDDSWDRRYLPAVLDALELGDGGYTVLMFHQPHGLEAAAQRGIDLVLSGHTHGGQFYPFNLMARAIWRRYKGLYQLKGARMFVSSGIGTWGPPMRIGTSSMIGLIRLRGRPA